MLIITHDFNEQKIFADKLRKFISKNGCEITSRKENNWNVDFVVKHEKSVKDINISLVSEDSNTFEMAADLIMPTMQVSKEFILQKYYNSKKRMAGCNERYCELLLLLP